MGILGYPNMDDGNNHDGIFGDYSEVYSNYSNEDSNVVQNTDVPSDSNYQEVAQQDLQKESLANDSVTPVAPQSGLVYFSCGSYPPGELWCSLRESVL